MDIDALSPCFVTGPQTPEYLQTATPPSRLRVQADCDRRGRIRRVRSTIATPPDVVEFERVDLRRVVARMEAIAARDDEKRAGWVNLGPALTDEQFSALPSRTGLGAWVSGRGPVVPLATWMPATKGKRPRSAQLGIEHGAGPRSLERLREAGLGLPDGWSKRQDHAKHGIVIEIPDRIDLEAMTVWLLRALIELSPIAPEDDRWIAEIHEPG